MNEKYPYIRTWLLFSVISISMYYLFLLSFYVDLDTDFSDETAVFKHNLFFFLDIVVRPCIIGGVIIFFKLRRTTSGVLYATLISVLISVLSRINQISFELELVFLILIFFGFLFGTIPALISLPSKRMKNEANHSTQPNH